MQRTARRLAFVPLLLVFASSLPALSLIPPVNLFELAQDSDAVVLARALGSNVAGEEFFVTRTTFLVQRVLRGNLVADGTLVVETWGGRKGDIVCISPGMPEFEIGPSYFLCLSSLEDGTWVPRMASYGILKEMAGDDGLPTLSPLREMHVAALSRPDGAVVEAIGSYRTDDLVSHLGACLSGTAAWDRNKVLTLETRILSVLPAGCSQFSITDVGGTRYYLRWFEFDGGGSITMSADQSNDAQVDALSLVPPAISAWNTVGNPNGRISIAYGGTVPIATNCGSADSFTAEGRLNNTIVFNDPCHRIPDLTPTGGVLANGGVRLDLGQGVTASRFGGDGCTLWVRVLAWHMLVNNNIWGGFGLQTLDQYRMALTHELGHGLGFDHVADSGALMYANCCNEMNGTDRTCANFVYPRPQGGIQVTPTSLDFGTVTTGTQKTLQFTVRSVGNANLFVESFGIDVGTLGGFSMTAPSTALVSPCVPDPSFKIDVRFSPTQAGVDSGAAILISNDMAATPTVISLSGEGVAPLVPDIDVSSSLLQFGNVHTGTAVDQTVTVRNVGQASLNVSSVSLFSGGPVFSVSGPTSANLLPGASFEFQVLYAPTAMGPSSGSIRIASSDPDESLATIGLQGTGLQPRIQVTPAFVNFSDVLVGTTRDLGFSITSSGNSSLTVHLSLGAGDPAFSYVGPDVIVLPPSNSTTVIPSFSPAFPGEVTRTFFVDSDDPTLPRVSVQLTGNGEAAGGRRLPGDCNEDGRIDISDPVCVLGFLFLGQPTELPCGSTGGSEPDAADVSLVDWNGDSQLDLSDPVAGLIYSFGGGPPHALDPDGQASTCVTIEDCSARCGS